MSAQNDMSPVNEWALRALADEWLRRVQFGRTGYSPYEGGTHATGLAQAAAELRRALDRAPNPEQREQP